MRTDYRNERDASNALASQAAQAIAKSLDSQRERQEWARVLGQPVRRRTTVRLGFVQRLLAQVQGAAA